MALAKVRSRVGDGKVKLLQSFTCLVTRKQLESESWEHLFLAYAKSWYPAVTKLYLTEELEGLMADELSGRLRDIFGRSDLEIDIRP